MSTRSTIAIRRKDGAVESVYCHFDGYLEGVGATLLDWYQSDEAVEQLIAGGDMSSLGHSLSGTEFYSRRGESTPARKHADLAAYASYIDPVWHEYNYLWDGGSWKWSRDGASWKPLKKKGKKRVFKC